MAIRMGISGSVTFVVDLDEQGHILAARPVKSSSSILNAAALDVIRGTVFRPELRDCKAVPSTFYDMVVFDASTANASTSQSYSVIPPVTATTGPQPTASP
jgi:TonB family protein